MILLESILLADPFADKLSTIQQDSLVIETSVEEVIFDIRKIYEYSDSSDFVKSELLKEKLMEYHNSLDEEIRISSKVISNSLNVVDILYPSILNELDIDNITSTPYGTVVIDWEKDSDNVFSLEIGDKQIGYFIEIDGKDVKQFKGAPLKVSSKEFLEDISNFLS